METISSQQSQGHFAIRLLRVKRRSMRQNNSTITHVSFTEQQPFPGLLHGLLMSHTPWACHSVDSWPRNICLSTSWVGALRRVPVLLSIPFVSSWLSLHFTGNQQQRAHLQRVSMHLLPNANLVLNAYNYLK